MKKVYFENLISGALLKFNKINGFDIYILIDDISKINNVEYSSEYHNIIEKYIKDEDAIISLKKYEYKNELLKMQGNIIKNYFENMNLEMFILKKLKLFGSVSTEVIETYFDNSQIEYFDYLFKEGYISIERENFVITRFGLLTIFLMDNTERLVLFCNEIKLNNLNEILLNEYLNIQEDFDNPDIIFNISEYKCFYDTFGKNLIKN